MVARNATVSSSVIRGNPRDVHPRSQMASPTLPGTPGRSQEAELLEQPHAISEILDLERML
jgi:hypothetical protein